MGFGLCSHRGVFAKARDCFAISLALLVALSPNLAAAASTSTVPFTSPGSGQGGAQNSAGNTNSLAQGLSAAMGVVSMGLGGLYMAKGAQQLTCCSSGCTGSGSQSQTSKAAQDAQSLKEAERVKALGTGVTPQFKLQLPSRYDRGVKNDCPAPQRKQLTGGIFSLLEFFQPPKAVAGVSGCLDAMIALATGGLMMLQGLMSLNAANQAGQNADNSYANAAGMSSYPGATGTSPTPDSLNGGGPGSSKLGEGSKSGELVKIDPSLLRTGKANDIMGQFENKFGIGRDQFAKSVLAGEDPRRILGTAPRNALSNDDMNKATNAAKGMSDADKANALAASGLADAQKEMAGKLGDSQYEVKVAGGSGGAALGGLGRTPAKSEDLDALDALNKADAQGLALSPEVKAALEQKAANDRVVNVNDLSLFQVVHNKYREKSKMIFGYDPDPSGTLKGVGNADGM